MKQGRGIASGVIVHFDPQLLLIVFDDRNNVAFQRPGNRVIVSQLSLAEWLPFQIKRTTMARADKLLLRRVMLHLTLQVWTNRAVGINLDLCRVFGIVFAANQKDLSQRLIGIRCPRILSIARDRNAHRSADR